MPRTAKRTLAKVQGECKWCQRPFTNRLAYEPRFCNELCKEKYDRNQGIVPKVGGRNDSQLQRTAKALAFDNLYDPVRDLVREEVRATITQRVKDNVLGMTELLSDMLPLVLNGLAVDLQSEDVFIRQKAQALILKYVMPLKNEEAVADDSRTLNVIHRVAVPDTVLGEAVEAELAALPPGVEAFEKDWPVCYVCNERKNPATGDDTTHGWRCTACKYRERARQGGANPTADNDRTVELMGE